MWNKIFLILFLIYFLIPICFKYSSSIQKKVIYRNFFGKNEFTDYNIDSYVASVEKIHKLSILLLTPIVPIKKSKIIIFFHGTGGNIFGFNRINILKTLSKLNFYILSFDYRGFGYSDNINNPSRQSTLEDSIEIFNYVKTKWSDLDIIFYGQSLGTAIASDLVGYLTNKNLLKNDFLILDAPFCNITSLIKSNKIVSLWSWLPFFDFITNDIKTSDVNYEIETTIKTIKISILIFHSLNDYIIPYNLGGEYLKGDNISLISLMNGHLDNHKSNKFIPSIITFLKKKI